MLRKNIKIFIVIILFLLCSGFKSSNHENNIKMLKQNENERTYLGYLIIPSINFKQGFFYYNNPLNDVDKNIEYIDTKIKNTYLFAGHSGIGKKAYFNDLKNLKVKDLIILEFKNESSEYEIMKIKNEEKIGKIKIKNVPNQLILVTCNQLIKNQIIIIEAILKK